MKYRQMDFNVCQSIQICEKNVFPNNSRLFSFDNKIYRIIIYIYSFHIIIEQTLDFYPTKDIEKYEFFS